MPDAHMSLELAFGYVCSCMQGIGTEIDLALTGQSPQSSSQDRQIARCRKPFNAAPKAQGYLA